MDWVPGYGKYHSLGNLEASEEKTSEAKMEQTYWESLAVKSRLTLNEVILSK